MKSILILFAISIYGCSNFNRTDLYRAMEQLEEIRPVVTISGATASSEADRAMERARLWLRNNSTTALRETGRDTIVSQPPPLSEFGYRVVRFDSSHNVRLEVAQRGFTGYSDGAATINIVSTLLGVVQFMKCR